MKSRGFFQTPEDIIEEYNGCSALRYSKSTDYFQLRANLHLVQLDHLQKRRLL